MKSGAPTRTRTADLLITNQLLYQLSYRGKQATLQAGFCDKKTKKTRPASGCYEKIRTILRKMMVFWRICPLATTHSPTHAPTSGFYFSGGFAIHLSMHIELSNICCARGGQAVLQNVSFSLGLGKCVLLRGGNGTGKTTLLKTLAGLASPSSGRLKIDPDSAVFLAHSNGLKPALSVAENLHFWARIYCADKTQLASVITDLHLTALRDYPAHTLSAGQCRRVAFGRILLAKAAIWLLDEPLAALDKDNAKLIKTIIESHCKTGMAVISTHQDLNLPRATDIDLTQFRPTQTTQDSTYWGLA